LSAPISLVGRRRPRKKIRRGSDIDPCACLDDAEVVPDSGNVRKEKMLVARNFPGRRRASLSIRDKNQLERLPNPAQIGGVSAPRDFAGKRAARSRHGFAPQREKDSRGGGSGLRACLDDAQVVPDSSNVRKEKMLVARNFSGRCSASASKRNKIRLDRPLFRGLSADLG
jgi:hypothetical protein